MTGCQHLMCCGPEHQEVPSHRMSTRRPASTSATRRSSARNPATKMLCRAAAQAQEVLDALPMFGYKCARRSASTSSRIIF